MAGPRNPYIASVGKALAALTVIAERRDSPLAKELAEALGVPAPTVYHLLNTLVAQGAVVKDGSRGGYRLGPRIGLLADAYLEQGEPLAKLEGPLKDLADRTGETAYLSGWRRGELEVIATAEGSFAVRVAQLQRGTVGSAHARASGKLLLAYARPGLRDQYLKEHPLERLTPNTICDRGQLDAELARIRARGYAEDREEFSVDVACLAAPVLSSGHVIGVYTVSSPSTRFAQSGEKLLTVLLDVCAQAQAVMRDQADTG